MSLAKDNPSKNLGAKSASGFFLIFVSQCANQVINIICIALLSRLVTPYDYGVIGAAMLFVEFTNILNSMGLAPTLVRKTVVTKEDEYTAYTSSIAIGVILYILTVGISWPAATFFKIPELGAVLRVLGIIYVISSFSTVSQVLLSRDLKFKALAINTVLSQFFGWGIVSVTMAYFGYGYWSLVGGRLANITFSTIGLLYRQPHSRKIAIHKKSLKEIYRFGSKLSVNSIILYFAQQSDTIIVGRVMGATSLGLYNRAYSLMALLANFLGNSLNRVLLPSSTKVKDNLAKMADIFNKLIIASSITLLPISVFIIIFSTELIHILLGSKWSQVVLLFQILALGTYFRFAYRIGSSLTITLGRLKAVIIRQIIYWALVVVTVIIGLQYGLAGVATGVLISLATNYILCSFQLMKIIQFPYTSFLKAHLPSLKISLLVFLINYPIVIIFRNHLHLNDVLILSIGLLASLAIFTLIYFLMPQFFGEDQISLITKLTQAIFKSGKAKKEKLKTAPQI